MNVDSVCVSCNMGQEPVHHLFDSCTCSKIVMQDEFLSGQCAEYITGNLFASNVNLKARQLLAFLFLSVAVTLFGGNAITESTHRGIFFSSTNSRQNQEDSSRKSSKQYLVSTEGCQKSDSCTSNVLEVHVCPETSFNYC